MTSAIATIALFAPIIASNAIFSARRTKRGVDAMDENPLFAIANFDIAAAQILKGARAAKAISIAIDPSFEIINKGSREIIKSTTVAGKTLKSIGKIVNFTADNINPIIIGAGAVKVLGSDDKLDALARESTALTCMFGAEALAKSFVGMPILEKQGSKVVAKARIGSYKKLMSKVLTKEQCKKITEYIASKKALKYVGGGVKGLLFVGASIAGYKIGNKISDMVLGKKEEVKEKNEEKF